jgi:hypothetical protein
MKRMKKWSFLCIFLLTGSIFGANVLYQKELEPVVEEGYGEVEEVGTAFEKIKPSTVHEDSHVSQSGETVTDGNTAGSIDTTSEEAAESSTLGTDEPDSEQHTDGMIPGTDAVASGDLTANAIPGADTSGNISGEQPLYRDPSEVVYQQVDDTYFADAVFIGDSRTVGMMDYGGLKDISTFYASTGLTVYKIFTAPIVTVPEEKQKITIEEALNQRQFAKIYLMIGINEMGTGTVDSFLEKYQEVVTHLRELQPNAILYLQSIMKVSTKRSDQGDYINNPGIDARNQGIAQMADNVSIYYLDVNGVVTDADGGMEPSYTFDGVHLKAQYIPLWKDYLKAHAVVLPE